MNLFVYGTLKDRDFIQSLLERSLGDSSAAIMLECATVTSKWGYLSVEGVVWQGLTVEDFVILDRYESCHVETPVYQRERRKVIIEDEVEEVWAYFGTPIFLTQIC